MMGKFEEIVINPDVWRQTKESLKANYEWVSSVGEAGLYLEEALKRRDKKDKERFVKMAMDVLGEGLLSSMGISKEIERKYPEVVEEIDREIIVRAALLDAYLDSVRRLLKEGKVKKADEAIRFLLKGAIPMINDVYETNIVRVYKYFEQKYREAGGL